MKKRIICLIGCICILLFSGCLPIGVAPQQTQPPKEETTTSLQEEITTSEPPTEEQQPPVDSSDENKVAEILADSAFWWRHCKSNLYSSLMTVIKGNQEHDDFQEKDFVIPKLMTEEYCLSSYMAFTNDWAHVRYFYMPIEWLMQRDELPNPNGVIPFDATVGIRVFVYHGEVAEEYIQVNKEKLVDGKYYDSEKNTWSLALDGRWICILFPQNLVVSAEELREYFTFEVLDIPQITRVQAEQVEEGMTYAEVFALFGKAGLSTSGGGNAYTWEIEGEALITLFVISNGNSLDNWIVNSITIEEKTANS